MILSALAGLPGGTGAVLALAQAGTVVADTVVTIAASPTGLQRWVDLLTSIASIVIALALIAIAIPVIPAAWNTRKLYKQIYDMVNRSLSDVRPALHHLNDVAENVNFMSAAVRSDVERLQGTLAAAQSRLNHTVVLAEDRINQFNALLQVVQEEAEDLFINTAATAHGVRAGAEKLRSLREDGSWLESDDSDGGADGPTIRVRPRPNA